MVGKSNCPREREGERERQREIHPGSMGSLRTMAKCSRNNWKIGTSFLSVWLKRMYAQLQIPFSDRAPVLPCVCECEDYVRVGGRREGERSPWLSEGWAKIHHRSIVLCVFFLFLFSVRCVGEMAEVHKTKRERKKGEAGGEEGAWWDHTF